MKLLKQIFFIFSVFVLSLFGIYSVIIFAPNINSAATADTNNSSVFSLSENEEENVSPNSSVSSAASPDKEKSNSSSSTVAVQADNADAKGKVITKSVGFSSGNLKYSYISVNNTTGLSINLKSEFERKLNIKLADTKSPQVLIVHTHTTESYLSEKRDYYTEADAARSTDDSKNLIAVGKILKSGLEANGIGVVHATEKHDYPEYTGSYSRAAVTINKYLKKYPTIKFVIDLHRDAMMDNNGNKTALVSKINGQNAAQVMIVAGCQNGGVTGFPDWRENFSLAVKLQQTMESNYKGLARPILFTNRKYNQHLTTGSLLIECGTDVNTLDEAKYSALLLSEAISKTLKSLK